MAASSTERVDPLRCAEACNEQITAHFTVASTCHQCTRSRAIASPPAAAYDPSSSSREPKPPTSPLPPKRQAGAHSHPTSSAGSPAWASSQSSTPRRPSGPTRKLPRRKSPCTVTRRPAAGRCRSSQRTPSSSAGRASPSASRKDRGWPRGSVLGRPSIAPGSMVWMAASAPAHCAVSACRAPAHSASRRILRGMVSPSSHSTTSQSAPRSSPTPMASDPGHRHPRCARRLEERALHPHLASLGAPSPRSIWRIIRRGPPPASSSSNTLVTREAPPESRRSPRTVPPSRRPSASASSSVPSRGAIVYSTGTTGLPPSSSWCRYSQMP